MLAASASRSASSIDAPRLVRVRRRIRSSGISDGASTEPGRAAGSATPGRGPSGRPVAAAGPSQLHRLRRRWRRPDSGQRGLAGGLGRGPTVTPQEFVGEVAIGLRALRFGPIEGDRQAVAGRLGQADAARDHGLVDRRPRWRRTSAATSADRFVRVSNIVSRTPLIASSGLRWSRTRLIGGDELAQPLEGVVLALDRDQHRVGRGQGVDGEQAERRRAIDEDVVVVRRRSVLERRREAAFRWPSALRARPRHRPGPATTGRGPGRRSASRR